jgi:predicted Holliday junction resolvase-like endonuclease
MAIFDFLAKLLGGNDSPCSGDARPCEELWEAVDRVVRMSHPNIHYVPDYRKKLMPSVERTLKYADEIIAEMKAPVQIDRDSWDKDPFLRAVFLSEKQYRKFFSENRKLKEYFNKTGASKCCALMVMNRNDRVIYGAEMEGNIIKRDVARTSVTFSDHQIVKPAASEAETRKKLAMSVLSVLSAHALEEIMSLIEFKKKMETEKKALEIRLQIHKTAVNSRKSLLPDTDDKKDEATEILEEIDRKIAEVRTEIDEPEDYIRRVIELMNHPEKFFMAKPVKLLLNSMNVITGNIKQENAEEINFLELTIATGIRRATVLVNCTRF